MKLRIQNFRSLKDTGDIEIKPITVLIGKNSSGKSSFLRTFPMLKQSTQEKTVSPILLFGDYVDFGSYNDIKPHFSKDNEMLYELGFTINTNSLSTLRQQFRYSRSKRLEKEFEFRYSLRFYENKKQLIQIVNIKFEVLENKINIIFDQENKKITEISLNNKKIFGVEDNLVFLDDGEFSVDIYQEKKISEKKNFEQFSHLVRRELVKIISKYVHGGTENEAKIDIIRKIGFSDDDEIMLKEIKSITSPSSWKKRSQTWSSDSKEFKELKNYFFLYDFFTYYSDITNTYLKSLFLNINYIAPLRATAERYYRIQHLAVDEVDQNGKNLPVFLGSLSDSQLVNFQSWTYENFGFKTKISKIEGHYSIKIEHEDKYEINLSDMGFGYSQILPILTQIWHSSTKKRAKRNSFLYSDDIEKIIVIEQPELHLHPDFQAKFADAISKIITSSKKNNISLKLIIETHSDVIINRFGDNILNNEISNEDINIVIFDKKNEISPTEIKNSYFDIEGNLRNWPLGFFQPPII
ncbi:AAA family ATPase [Flavobacterium sp. MMLR14_040]|uniref:AAA family ATPase n=1 Tax=Flavobacterium sp. MMLR14_040 TaxID=3093843 RepID=UPI00298FA711|nr:AAA family ATPase [Flavobacterium sp. MMLR14_040]MDW8851259.1 AAA family ATPase [Flavobacterium sp. MMLR14_040]